VTTQKEARALIIAARVHLTQYKTANNALKATKEALTDYLNEIGEENVDGEEEGTGAKLVTRLERTLLIEGMPDALVIWCARNGLLNGSITAIDGLPDAQRAAISEHVGMGEGAPFIDIYFPSWSQQQQQRKASARAANTAPPTPIRQPPPPTPAATPQTLCPEHGKGRLSPKTGSMFCPSKMDDGTWCKWTSQKKAS
jgi:hypothetical protein